MLQYQKLTDFHKERNGTVFYPASAAADIKSNNFTFVLNYDNI